MGIDASISGEHARIVYDEEGDFLHIMDGTPTKVRLFFSLLFTLVYCMYSCCGFFFVVVTVSVCLAPHARHREKHLELD